MNVGILASYALAIKDGAAWSTPSQFVRDNAEALSQCAEVAQTAGEDQQCVITVKVQE